MTDNYWRYENSSWNKTGEPFDWPDGQSLDEAARAVGYNRADEWGVPDLGQVEIYAHKDEDRWLIFWCVDQNRVHTIVVEHLPSLLDLLQKLSGIATASLLTGIAEELRELIRNASEDGKRERARRHPARMAR